MKPPGKTTLERMSKLAQIEVEHIEIVEDYWVSEGRIKEPRPFQVTRRDNFAGIVRLIDLIQSDRVILERLTAARKRITAGE